MPLSSSVVASEADDPTVLSRRLARSDRAAFEQLFRRLRGGLVRFVEGIVHDPEVAHDVVQDVFVELWVGRAEIDPERSIKAFLYRAARNRAYNAVRNLRLKHQKHEEIKAQAVHHTTEADGPEGILDAGLLGQSLEEWLSQLPERQAEALRLSRFDGLTHEEIAAIMEISPRTVNNHIVRALATLAERLRDFQAVRRQ